MVELGPPRGSREFAEDFGYGMVLSPPSEEKTVSQGQDSDANAAIVAAMSSAERAAYDEALYGDGGDRHFSSGDEIDTEELGCAAASADVAVNSRGRSDPVYVDAMAYLRHIDDVVLVQDPRMVAADAVWSACMSDAGWPGLLRQPDAYELASSWLDSRYDESIDPPSFPSGTHAQNERWLATADWDCRAGADYDDLRTEIRTALQDEYLQDHRAELEGWVQQWSQE